MSVPWRSIISDIKKTGNKYVLAVSGGVDSMFGLNFFYENNIDFVVAHFNHRIRNDSSLDEELVKKTSDELDKECVVGYGVDIKSECDARNQRYDFLYKVKDEYACDKIVTFHHADDQVETIILNLTRGRQHDKLAMKKYGDSIYRPFLDISKSDLQSMALKKNLTWNEDSTNIDTSYERNWIRHEVIPFLSKKRNIKKAMLGALNKAI